ncbi:MAG TPA: hypothetical protein VJ023_10075 [Pyrinomonadaceae bacterium]|nr:hypothetical protein [Pyrinomonadaceae bacterium]
MLTARVLLVLLVLFSSSLNLRLLGHSRGLNSSSSVVTSTPLRVNEVTIENTIGVITLNEKTATSRAEKFRFFNEDGSLWYEFSFYDDDNDLKFDQAKANFRPFAFHQDYFVLALKCVGQDASRFKVVVNEKTQLIRFIRKDDLVFKFQSWEEHILDLFAVSFDPIKNPLRIAPREPARAVRLPRDVMFHPRQVNGKWLKVSWNVTDEGKGKVKKVEYGWVKWKESNKLLIERFYFS